MEILNQTDGRTDTRSTQNYSSEPHKTSQKKCFSSDGQTDGRTDTRSTQNYSSEPHKTSQKKCFSSDGETDGRTDTRSTQNYSSKPHKNLIFKIIVFKYGILKIKFFFFYF